MVGICDVTPLSSRFSRRFVIMSPNVRYVESKAWIFSSGKCKFLSAAQILQSPTHHCSSHGQLLCPDKANNPAQCTTTLVRPPIEASRRLENSIASGSAKSEKWTATRPSHTEPWRFPVISRRTRSSYLCVVVGLIVHVWCECGVRV